MSDCIKNSFYSSVDAAQGTEKIGLSWVESKLILKIASSIVVISSTMRLFSILFLQKKGNVDYNLLQISVNILTVITYIFRVRIK